MKYRIKGHKLIITIDYLDPSEPSIPKIDQIPVSDSFQGMRTDFAYEKIHIIEKALRMYKKAKNQRMITTT
jgi:hypothetical protein